VKLRRSAQVVMGPSDRTLPCVHCGEVTVGVADDPHDRQTYELCTVCRRVGRKKVWGAKAEFEVDAKALRSYERLFCVKRNTHSVTGTGGELRIGN
jgi:hypothetical protein